MIIINITLSLSVDNQRFQGGWKLWLVVYTTVLPPPTTVYFSFTISTGLDWGGVDDAQHKRTRQ